MSLAERLLMDSTALGWAFACVTVVRSRPAERVNLMYPVTLLLAEVQKLWLRELACPMCPTISELLFSWAKGFPAAP